MSFLSFEKNATYSLLCLMQIFLLLTYFALNIINVGEMGTALPLLAGFIMLAGGRVCVQATQKIILMRKHFFTFLVFIGWLVIRVLWDLQDLYYLKQVTIATTGGILLFFLIGTFTRSALDSVAISSKTNLSFKLFILYFTFLCIVIFQEYSSRLINLDVLFIEDVNDGYQRPGNFIIISFLVVSFIYIRIISTASTHSIFNLFLWLCFYTVGFVFALTSSQMIGSNAATANLVAIYMITIVISFLAFGRKIKKIFFNRKLGMPISKFLVKQVLKYALISASGVFMIASIIIKISGFDLTKTRIFESGDGTSSSVTSRMAILKETGVEQISYSPIWGDVNVAFMTTGDEGRTLHNFFPNIFAELGLIGLFIIVFLLIQIFNILIDNIRQMVKKGEFFQNFILNSWLLFILIYFLIYINFAVGKEWPVIWFFVGFCASIFVIKPRA